MDQVQTSGESADEKVARRDEVVVPSRAAATRQEMVEYLKRLGGQRGSAPEPNPGSWAVTFAIHLPDDFPGEIPYPYHFIGDRLYHQGISSQELGFVAGMEYAPAPHHSQGWQWRYKLYLDKQSPSSAWTRWDHAWEEDLVSANSDFETAQATGDAEDTA